MLKSKKRAAVNQLIGSSMNKYKWNFRLFKESNKSSDKKSNYIGFFFLYFAISVIGVYLIVYLPVFLLNILFIERSHLAFIQGFVYLAMFLGPLLGYLIDKYSRNKKLILITSSILFLASFLFSTSGGRNLGVFGFFLAINLLCQEILRVGVAKMIIDLSSNESVKDSILVIKNISSNIGSFIPSVVFLFTVRDIFIVNQWNSFFFIGFLASLPIILSTFLLRESTNKLIRVINIEQKMSENISLGRKNSLNLILLFISYLLIWSDKLYQFPFSSWILTRFGEDGFNIYSLLFIVLILLNIGGWIIGQRISNRENNRINKFKAENHISMELKSENRFFLFFVYSAYKIYQRK